MSDTHWDHSVIVVCNSHNELIVVATTREALEMLCQKWPKMGGRAHQIALATCLAVATGQASPMEARAAFIAAAAEVGIPIQT